MSSSLPFPLSLHDALPIFAFPKARIVHIVRDGRDVACSLLDKQWLRSGAAAVDDAGLPFGAHARFWVEPERDRKSTRLNSSHLVISYAVFCLKKKTKET